MRIYQLLCLIQFHVTVSTRMYLIETENEQEAVPGPVLTPLGAALNEAAFAPVPEGYADPADADPAPVYTGYAAPNEAAFAPVPTGYNAPDEAAPAPVPTGYAAHVGAAPAGAAPAPVASVTLVYAGKDYYK
ncbi:uncharacterized protein LOC111702553 [Eurytemora carolleeae]|uniref:uncharacterized protein LOC111702553 n=1 Tax=Eurytemora carolleeae TaxID=1294199 RepID=UPI000C787BB2|nr:uncharacterized protein LOC111702553 [Eurytemora carolleeae]|eukprot:XP_023330050.1 uncharacterized protein LOC111702553 [Eurytemora affinis]